MARGDHIKVARLGYSHHGIDVGGGEVIHISGEKKNKGNVSYRRVSKEEFAKGGEIKIVDYTGCDCLPPEEVVKRAESLLGQDNQYDFFGDNCEHIARWCKTGKKESKQVQRAVTTPLAGVVVRGLAGYALRGVVGGPVGWILNVATAAGTIVGFLANTDKTKPDDSYPKN